jgi:hypothetical protein
MVAPFLGAGQVHVLAQHVQQRGARVEAKMLDLAVHTQRYIDEFRGSRFGLMRCLRACNIRDSRSYANTKCPRGFHERSPRYRKRFGTMKFLLRVHEVGLFDVACRTWGGCFISSSSAR